MSPVGLIDDEDELPQLSALFTRRVQTKAALSTEHVSLTQRRRVRRIFCDSDDDDDDNDDDDDGRNILHNTDDPYKDSSDSPASPPGFEALEVHSTGLEQNNQLPSDLKQGQINVNDELGLALTLLKLDSDEVNSTNSRISEYFSCESDLDEEVSAGLKDEPEFHLGSTIAYSPPTSVNPRPVLKGSEHLIPSTNRRVPRSPFRESSVAFWDEKQNAAWIRQHAPISPEKWTTPSKPRAPRHSSDAMRKFIVNREGLAIEFVKRLIALIQPDLAKMLDGPIDIVWSKTLLTTAGRANYSKGKRIATIELSCKVIDNVTRLESTLAHEFCHLLTWCVSNQYTNPHGKEFKVYGARIEKRLGIHVATTHDYEINYKYKWQCISPECGQEYGRHSKSLDPTKVLCGRCRSALRQIQPIPRSTSQNASPNKSGLLEYQLFLKQNMERVKALNPTLKYAELRKLVTAEYSQSKVSKPLDLSSITDTLKQLKV